MTDYSKLTDREIDALVAERVMGWVKVSTKFDNVWSNAEGYPVVNFDLFQPTDDANDMMLVVEKMIEFGVFVTLKSSGFYKYDPPKGWKVIVHNGETILAQIYDDTLPRAVCEAALKVVEAADE